jgi:hypothetical protein
VAISSSVGFAPDEMFVSVTFSTVTSMLMKRFWSTPPSLMFAGSTTMGAIVKGPDDFTVTTGDAISRSPW